MGLYGKRKTDRCTFCKHYELPCGDRIHMNDLARYVPLVETTVFSPEEVVRPRPLIEPRTVMGPPETMRRARQLSAVAVACIVLAALIAGLSAIAYFAYGNLGGDAPGCGTMCRPVQFTTGPSEPPDSPWRQDADGGWHFWSGFDQ